jgi:hypothetical protein
MQCNPSKYTTLHYTTIYCAALRCAAWRGAAGRDATRRDAALRCAAIRSAADFFLAGIRRRPPLDTAQCPQYSTTVKYKLQYNTIQYNTALPGVTCSESKCGRNFFLLGSGGGRPSSRASSARRNASADPGMAASLSRAP